MNKRGNAFRIIAIVVLVIALAHTIVHAVIYGTGVQGFGESGVSGLAIGDTSTEDIKLGLPQFSSKSGTILMGEWLVFIAALITTLVISKASNHKEIIQVDIKSIPRGKSKTDLDVLYDLLKEKGKLKLSSITSIFKIPESKAIEWTKILESGNLAEMNYPRIGEPELVFKK